MPARIAVVDYGGGNMGSLVSALERRGASFVVTADPETVVAADAAILPGDGAFGSTMEHLATRGLDAAVRAIVAAEKPFLGICVGMVTRFTSAPRVPHMGWNALELASDHPFVRGLAAGSYAYFLHSYRADVGATTIASSEHGERFSAIEARDHVMATQFHPEKSGATGAVLLDNFIAIAKAGT